MSSKIYLRQRTYHYILNQTLIFYHLKVLFSILITSMSFNFNNKETELLGSFMSNSLICHNIALELKESFVGRCIIDPNTTTRFMIEHSPEFVPFMRALFQVSLKSFSSSKFKNNQQICYISIGNVHIFTYGPGKFKVWA